MSRVAFALLIPAVGRDVRLEEVESETSQIHSEGTKEGENGVEHLKFGLLQLVPTYVLVSTPRGPSPARPARRGLPGAACPAAVHVPVGCAMLSRMPVPAFPPADQTHFCSNASSRSACWRPARRRRPSGRASS